MKSSYLNEWDTFNTSLWKTDFLNHLSLLSSYSPERINTLPFGTFIYKFGLQQIQYFQGWCTCYHHISLEVYCFRENSSGKFQKTFMWSKCKAKDTAKIVINISLHKRCLYSELSWSAFFRIRTEYGKMQSTSPYSFQMRENANQNNAEYGHFLRSVCCKNKT